MNLTLKRDSKLYSRAGAGVVSRILMLLEATGKVGRLTSLGDGTDPKFGV